MADDEELAICTFCDAKIPADAVECPECGEGFEEEEDSSIEEKDTTISKKLFFMGNLFCLAGIAGIVGLRLGIIQNVLGDPDPYPGIGHVEPTGHIVSMIPLVIGVLMVFFWGLRNDPIYYEMERAKEEETDEAEEELDELQFDVSAELKEPLEPAEEMATEELPAITEEKLPEEYEELLDEIKEVAETKIRPKVPRKAPELDAEADRVTRCEKMLAVAKVLPEDKEKLWLLIPTGISASKFTSEMKKAIERKKMKDEEDYSSEEKAAILEEELVQELANLEEELDSDELGDEGLEDQILKEIEDLEDV